MPPFINKENVAKGFNAAAQSPITISRLAVIEQGVQAFNELGMTHICKVCIANSGSCCHDCSFLKDGVGCQNRNTGCTAWLCGFQKYFLYEIGQLKQWNDFWEQIPGQEYREDFTPVTMEIQYPLEMDTLSIEHLGEDLAYDLQELAHTHQTKGFILMLREKLDNNIDQLINADYDNKKKAIIRRKIKVLSTPLYRFQSALQEYRERKQD